MLQMVSGKMMEQGPVLIITFQAFMINVVKNADGKVVQGDPVSFSLPFPFLFTIGTMDVAEQPGACASCVGAVPRHGGAESVNGLEAARGPHAGGRPRHLRVCLSTRPGSHLLSSFLVFLWYLCGGN